MRFTTLSRLVCAGALLGLTTVMITGCGGGGTGSVPFPAPTAPVPRIGNSVGFVVSPTSLVLSTTSATPTSETFTVSEAGYGGVFSGVIACTENPAGQTPTANAFVAEFASGLLTATETPTTAGAPVTFSVEPGGETGSCTVTITDTNSNLTTVTVTVSSTAVVVFGKHRN